MLDSIVQVRLWSGRPIDRPTDQATEQTNGRPTDDANKRTNHPAIEWASERASESNCEDYKPILLHYTNFYYYFFRFVCFGSVSCLHNLSCVCNIHIHQCNPLRASLFFFLLSMCFVLIINSNEKLCIFLPQFIFNVKIILSFFIWVRLHFCFRCLIFIEVIHSFSINRFGYILKCIIRCTYTLHIHTCTFINSRLDYQIG